MSKTIADFIKYMYEMKEEIFKRIVLPRVDNLLLLFYAEKI